MTDQEVMSTLLAGFAALIMGLQPRARDARRVGADVPHYASSCGGSQSFTHAVAPGVKQGHPAAVAMILNPETFEADGGARRGAGISGIVVTEPSAGLEGQAADPFVLDLRERLNIAIQVKRLTV